MNLRVDLIIESEQRSASAINPKSLLRMTCILAPIIIVCIGILTGLKIMNISIRAKQVQQEWTSMEPKQKQALKLTAQLKTNKTILSELNGWKKSHINWNAQLLNIQKSIPAQIQLESIKIHQTLQINKKKIPARAFTLTLAGIAVGPTADQDIQSLRGSLESGAAFKDFIESVDLKGREDPLDKGNRLFTITCEYKPREFK